MFLYPMLVRILTSRPYKIEGDSMLPVLADGQYVLITQVIPASRPLQRGDIVVHRHPMGLDGIYVKRIIGLPDEHLRLDGGLIYIDDVLLEDNRPDSADSPDLPIKEWWNGSDEYVVMGDNRRESHDDSRAFGTVPEKLLLGRVWFRYWPLKGWE